MKVGTKFEVVKGGTLNVYGPIRLKMGEIWDIVKVPGGTQFRKLNRLGGSTCYQNGFVVAMCGKDAGRLREMAPDEPKAVDHDELRKRTGAR